MERRENLVMTNITWDADITTKSKQCLVTWEVYGGGLMGNLLTDCCLVELSLWPDTRYNVHVTCKTKVSYKFPIITLNIENWRRLIFFKNKLRLASLIIAS